MEACSRGESQGHQGDPQRRRRRRQRRRKTTRSATETAEKRDLAKARKFKRMSDAGAIPDHIYEALEKAKTRSSAQTALINQLFEKNGRGKLTMKLEKPVFEVTKSAKHQKYGKDETIGVPRNVMLHRDFRGDELALSASIAKGTVLVWMQDGVEFAGYRQTVAGIGKKVDEKKQGQEWR